MFAQRPIQLTALRRDADKRKFDPPSAMPIFSRLLHGDSVYNTVKNSSTCLLPNLNALAAVSKGMRAVKLCTNEIIQFFKKTGSIQANAGWSCIRAVKW